MSEKQSVRDIIGQALGEASMCWTETPQGIFDSDRASKILDDVCAKIDHRSRLESLINGHMEAMRPLLEEWSKL